MILRRLPQTWRHSTHACAADFHAGSSLKSSVPPLPAVRRSRSRFLLHQPGGEIAALVDTFDRLDVASAAAAGIDLERLLWVRGPSISLGTSIAASLGPSTAFGTKSASGGQDAAVNRALKAVNLVLQAGGFGCVVLDLADVPPVALRRIPFTTWLRVQRIIDGSDTACVLIAPHPLARSAGGLTLSLAGRVRWTGDADRSRHLTGADIDVRIVSPRRRFDGAVSINVSTHNAH